MKMEDSLTGEEFESAELPLQVCSSMAGYYIGQLEPSGSPFSRMSTYFKTRKEAEMVLKQGWDLRDAPENIKLISELRTSGKIKIKRRVDPES